ncbi:MAG TPA: DUF1292 domain-containing protein [Oscillospiraceae bacterium]|nr:DUF1292 domain-containing protein [Oscillospiraceae bacterium]
MTEKNTTDPQKEEEFTTDIVTVIDEEGIEHSFEELDRIETDEGKFIALLPIYNDAEDIISESGELIVLQVSEEDDEFYLEPIENDELFNKIGNIFEERLQDLFEFTDNDEE